MQPRCSVDDPSVHHGDTLEPGNDREPAVNATQRMQCMEVWGGNRTTDSSFEMPGLRIWIYCRPYAQAESGGDVYYLSSCASGRISRLLLADVCGHGSAVAHTAESLRSLLRQNINYIDQSRLVSGVNQQFGELSNDGGFATALISTFFSPTRTLTLCNAGHPQPLLYRTGTQRWSVHDSESVGPKSASNLPLGVTDETRFVDFKTKLKRGDLLLCYTDALFEVRTSAGLLGAEGLAGLLQDVDASQPASIIAGLLQSIDAISSEALDQDDVTLMLVECTESGVQLRDNLAAPFRLLRSLFTRG